jgi:integrase
MTKSAAILLTDAAITKLKKAQFRRRIRDLGSQGLFLIIEPTGRKSWQMRLRRPGGKIGKITLGPVNIGDEITGEPVIGMPLTLRAARRLAAEVHRQRSLQRDVIADHKAEQHRKRLAIEDRQRENFAASARRYVEEHAAKRLRGWRETAKQLGLLYPPEGGEPELIRGGLAARWAEKTLREIDGHDIWTAMEEAKRHGVPGLAVKNDGASENRARHVRNALSALFAFAQRQRLVEVNPCRTVAPPTLPESRDRVLTADEVRWFWKACAGMGPFEAALKVLLLTGQRRDEVAGMLWDEVREHGEWHLPKERVKNKRAHVVPLPPAALALIIEREPRTVPNVFTTTKTTAISGWSKAKRRLDAEMLKLARADKGKTFELKPWVIHDLRRTAVTGMAELGIRPEVIEQVVNHVSGSRGGVAGIYNRSALLPERREALERWETHVLGIVEARAAKVVALPSRGEGRR